MSALDHRRHASLELLLAGARLQHRLGATAPPFLDEYTAELRGRGGWSGDYPQWRQRLWVEASAQLDLPLMRLCRAGAGQMGVEILGLAGLAAEDGRIAPLLGSQNFIAASALVALWREGPDGDQPERAREMTRWLVRSGLLTVVDPAAAHHAREMAITDAAWSMLMEDQAVPDQGHGPELDQLVLTDETRDQARQAARLLRKAPDTVIWLRGAQCNGRRTLARAIAAQIGLPVTTSRVDETDQTKAALGAFLRKAALLIDGTRTARVPQERQGELAVPPGQDIVTVAPCPLQIVPTFVVTGPRVALDAGGRTVMSIDLPLPDPAARAHLWQQAVPMLPERTRSELAAAWRIPAGALINAGTTAERAGMLDSPGVRRALRDLSDGRLDAVADRVPDAAEEGRPFLVLPDHAQTELDLLVLRCRHREALAREANLGDSGMGVRALLGGPSGAGKTLAARWLADRLGKDLWRIDLAAAVSKYIGETEKMLDRAFAAAEERDIVLLLDEGDALMARRTDVGNANDRYANLETNFLLQRLENFSGILIVTTNAADRIDPAFQRRMDAVIAFSLPDELARYQILQHLLGRHHVGDDLLQEIAVRCTLSGGQLRNVALHARLLAISGTGTLTERELRSAIEREYRKFDGFCPLRPLLSAVN